MTSYEERVKVIREEIKEILEYTNNIYQLDLSIESFEPFIKQRAKREVLTKKGYVKTSLRIEIKEIIKCAVSVAYKIKADFENREGDYYEGIEEGYKICMEEKVCKNCKFYSKRYFDVKGHFCTNVKNNGIFCHGYPIIEPDFGCNRFEKKEK